MSFIALEEAIWDYLNAQANYTALGLREYRSYAGNLGPFTAQTGWSGNSTPLLASDRVTDIGSRRVASGWEDECTTRFSLVYSTKATRGAKASRAEIDAAWVVIRDLLTSSDAQRTRLAAAGIVAQADLSPGRIIAWPGATEHPGAVAAWEYQFSVRVLGERRHS